MEIHIALKEILKEFGIKLLLDNHLVNFLADKSCFQEFRSAKKAIKEILQKYGDNIYELKSHNLPYKNEIAQYKLEFYKATGFQKELVSYLFDCISYSLDWDNDISNSLLKLRNTNLSSIPQRARDNKLLFYANLYHYFGINITGIFGKESDLPTYLYRNPWGSNEIRHPFKEPGDPNWKNFFSEQQTINYIQNINWNEASGIGAVIGYNGLRALDFDNLDILDNYGGGKSEKLDRYISMILKILELPKDYQWVTLSGSGRGIHVIFRTSEIDDFKCDSVGFLPNKKIKAEKQGFERVELRWKDHLVLPPSKSINYYNENLAYFPELWHYHFYFNDFPNYPPKTVEIDKLNNLLNYLTAEIDMITFIGSAKIIGHVKNTTEIDSWGGDHVRFHATQKWAELCKSTVCEEYISYLLGNKNTRQDNINEAIEILNNSNTSIAHYNYSSLIANRILPGSKQNAIYHYNEAAKDTNLKDELDSLKYDIERMEQN